jgi:hypothetical protein
MLLPDVVVVCGDLEPGATSTDEPAVIFEVLSTGTEARDRLEKWYDYQRLPSLQHYVLVARNKPHVEVFDRIAGTWSGMRVLDGLHAVLDLPAFEASVPLAGIYRRVPGLLNAERHRASSRNPSRINVFASASSPACRMAAATAAEACAWA